MLRGAILAQYLGQAVQGWKVKFLQLNLGRGKEAQNLIMQAAGRGEPMCCSIVGNTNGPKTLLGTRIHQGGLGSLFAALI